MAEAAFEAISRERLAGVVALMRRAFPQATKLTATYLDWLYFANPAGPALGYNASDGGRVVGHAAAVPQRVRLRGRRAEAALLLNIATDPDWRGRGLFLRLIEAVIDQARDRGVAAVTGVANQNTIRAYETRLGFQNVAGLDAVVALSPERVDMAAALARAELRRDWDDAALAWRLANPEGPLRIVSGSADTLVVEGASSTPGVRARGVIPRDGLAAPAPRAGRLWPAVSLGLTPAGAARRSLALPVPGRLRPSPLRLIYLNTSAPGDRLDPTRILFSFLDFDAF